MKIFQLTSALLLFASPQAGAADAANPSLQEEIVITGVRHSALATEASASAGAVTREQITDYPVLKPGELLQLVPGLVVVSHAAGGKANQYYLRGFELDHGDMFLTEVDNVPINMPTHVHGPGYTDINWLIPEITGGIDYEKGPYYADQGDFANAGTANFHFIDGVAAPLLKEEIGGDGYSRLLGVDWREIGPGTLLLAAEYMHDDGPWTVGNDYRRRNGILRYSTGDASDGLAMTLQGYRGNWRGGDQIPLRAIQDGSIPEFDVLDPHTGGTTSRYSLNGDWNETDDLGSTHANLYAVHYTLDLTSNFTYFLNDPVNGDEIRENERRWTYGGHIERDIDSDYLGDGTRDRFGLEIRDDDIHNFLNNTVTGRFLNNVRGDQVDEAIGSPWWENTVHWNEWLASIVGIRADVLSYADHSSEVRNSGNGITWKPSPKVGLKFGPWERTDFYFQAGLGISTEDIRGVTETVTPGSGGGQPAVSTASITRNRGAEVGIHTTIIPGLDSTVSVWVLESQNEFVFDGDSGAVDASGRPGRRWGIEWNNRWQPTRWLDVTANFALSRAHYLDQNNPVGNQIPESVRAMSSGELSVHDVETLPNATATLGWRYLGPRYLIEDSTVQAKPALVFNLKLQYDLTPNIKLGAEILNLLDTHYYDAQYYYMSRLPGEPLAGVAGYMVHPGELREFRFNVTERF